jgi:hypothetical protein
VRLGRLFAGLPLSHFGRELFMKDITGTRELSYAELEHKVEDLEDCMTQNDELMQKVYAENQAMRDEISDWHKVKGFEPKGALYNLDYFIEKYNGYSKERVILRAYAYMMALRNVYEQRQNLKGDQG